MLAEHNLAPTTLLAPLPNHGDKEKKQKHSERGVFYTKQPVSGPCQALTCSMRAGGLSELPAASSIMQGAAAGTAVSMGTAEGTT